MRIALITTIFLVSSTAAAQAPSASKAGAATVGGRFQLIQLSDLRHDQYLIDTQTGRLWQPVCTKVAKDNGPCEETLFVEVGVEKISFTPKAAH